MSDVKRCVICHTRLEENYSYDSVPNAHRRCHSRRVREAFLERRYVNVRNSWWRRAVQQARYRSKSKGYTDFELLEDEPILLPTFCPIFSLMLNYGDNVVATSPSIDQIIPHKGYKYGNVAIICARANRVKSDATADEHYKILSYMLRNGG